MSSNCSMGEKSGPLQQIKGSLSPSNTFQTVQLQPPVDDRLKQCAQVLLEALWRSPERVHQLWIYDRRTNRCESICVESVDEAAERASKLSEAGIDAYFACAEYLLPNSRKAENASGAFAFWLDLDCGEKKYAEGKGYRTTNDARAALQLFCRRSGLPEPTHIVSSGGGLHAYWALNQVVERQRWQAHASKLKSITKALGLLADDSRTADIASVLRLPGTLNYKTDPPKPVSLQYVSKEFVGQSTMLGAVDRAYDEFCGTALIKVPRLQRVEVSPQEVLSSANCTSYALPDLQRLTSALLVLDPDCDDEEWKLSRIAPLALLASQFPTYSAQLRELARSWSRGDLWVNPSIKWTNPGSNGRTGEEEFDGTWNRFLNSTYGGRPKTVATIFADAQEQGWYFGQAEQFEAIAVEAPGVQ